MSRPLRINVPGGRYHVTARGNERRPIYLSDRDRGHFVELLGEAATRFAWRLYAYVLMPNHYHLLVQTPQANLSQALHWLGVSYSVWFNRRYGREGHLFQGRFKAFLIDEPALLEVSRYLHLNPVRVAAFGLDKEALDRQRIPVSGAPDPDLVAKRLLYLRDFRWSSYRAYLGLEKAPPWLWIEAVLGTGGKAHDATSRYQAHVENAVREGLPESPWERLVGGLLLGRADFVRQMQTSLLGDRREQPSLRQLESRPSFTDVVVVVEQMAGEPWSEFRDRHGHWGRDLAFWLARRHCGLTLRALGKVAGGVDYVTVCMAIKRIGQRITSDPDLARMARKAQGQLLNEKT
jgi:putative transposase